MKYWKKKMGEGDSNLSVSEVFPPEHEEEIRSTKILKACINSLYRSQGLKDYNLQNHLDEDFKQQMDALSGFMSKCTDSEEVSLSNFRV